MIECKCTEAKALRARIAELENERDELRTEIEHRNFIGMMSGPTAHDKANIWRAQAFANAHDLAAAEADAARVREKARPFVLAEHHVAARSGPVVRIGTICQACDTSWRLGGIEHHTPDCFLTASCAAPQSQGEES